MNSFPTSSRVFGFPSSSPKRKRKTFSSLGVRVLRTSASCSFKRLIEAASAGASAVSYTHLPIKNPLLGERTVTMSYPSSLSASISEYIDFLSALIPFSSSKVINSFEEIGLDVYERQDYILSHTLT